MKKILLLNIVIIFLMASCCKDREDRTEYLTPLQKNIVNMYNEGDTFKMLRNNTDTIDFIVTQSIIGTEDEGMFCNRRWIEWGRLIIEGEWNIDHYRLYQRLQLNAGINYMDFAGSEASAIYEPKKILFQGIDDAYISYDYNMSDTVIFSLSKGFLKMKSDKVEYILIEE